MKAGVLPLSIARTVTLYKALMGVTASLSKILEVLNEPEISLMVIHPFGSCNNLYLLIKSKNSF